MTPDEDPENKFISSGRFFCQPLPPSHHAQIRETAKPSCSRSHIPKNHVLINSPFGTPKPHPDAIPGGPPRLLAAIISGGIGRPMRAAVDPSRKITDVVSPMLSWVWIGDFRLGKMPLQDPHRLQPKTGMRASKKSEAVPFDSYQKFFNLEESRLLPVTGPWRSGSVLCRIPEWRVGFEPTRCDINSLKNPFHLPTIGSQSFLACRAYDDFACTIIPTRELGSPREEPISVRWGFSRRARQSQESNSQQHDSYRSRGISHSTHSYASLFLVTKVTTSPSWSPKIDGSTFECLNWTEGFCAHAVEKGTSNRYPEARKYS
ncbi:uncharacterized protein CLUP02_17675 [Colletotrichum lupini]|uniref:Uncharacterized protein n=1 Tax=Colletotrichum lupini TaxID=145971 RepID=A0A9Q8WAH3_9PEZI|nr:uncharacterized protein CLUP02_17675 [Colletotrichum lupini]UQC76164.1 hypothetical protein CLUP02_17675 [Colletotrichum lupini]